MTTDSELSQWDTWAEIHRQPEVWEYWGSVFDVSAVRGWIAQQEFDQVWFCGAGTSAYIGDILQAGLPHGRKFLAIPSTDLVGMPQRYLKDAKPLVVNFGRSGNSAESIGTLDALDAFAPDAPRLNITCNANGALAVRKCTAPQQVVLLPDSAHDAGFAMTASFSTMLFTALALFDVQCEFKKRMHEMADQFRNFVPRVAKPGPLPERTVYLGSGPLAYAARESVLKVLELSAGNIPSLWDSTLGFRHGPKSFVTDHTAITVYLHPDSPASLYDNDLLAELRSQFPNASVQSVGPGGDIKLDMPFGAAWATPVCIVTAQIAAAVWAHGLGLNVDDPFAGRGTLSRVVSDVRLYPVEAGA